MIRVRALQRGFVGSLKEPGDEFDVEDRQFSERWMERVVEEPVKPKRGRQRKEVVQPEASAEEV